MQENKCVETWQSYLSLRAKTNWHRPKQRVFHLVNAIAHTYYVKNDYNGALMYVGKQ